MRASTVIPAQAGTQPIQRNAAQRLPLLSRWAPASAGVTN